MIFKVFSSVLKTTLFPTDTTDKDQLTRMAPKGIALVVVCAYAMLSPVDGACGKTSDDVMVSQLLEIASCSCPAGQIAVVTIIQIIDKNGVQVDLWTQNHKEDSSHYTAAAAGRVRRAPLSLCTSRPLRLRCLSDSNPPDLT